MLDKLFPTFSNWFRPGNTARSRIRSFRIWSSGPTWYIVTFFGDKLASHQRSLLRLLAVAHREQLETAPLVHYLADEHRGRYRWRLRRLAKHLDAGTPLIEALEQTPDALNDDTVLALRFGTQSGALQSTCESLLPENPISSDLDKSHTHAWAYWVILSISIGLMLLFLMTFIAPTFKVMFNEFGLQLPTPLKVLIAICDLVGHYAALWVFALIVLCGLLWSSAARRFFRRTIAPLVMQPLALKRTAELLKLLALSVDAGRPMTGALSTLARYHFDGRVRQRLLFARNEIEQGVESWNCLADANILTPQQAHSLASAPSNQIRAWTLRKLATAKLNTAQRRLSIGLAIAQPIVVLIFAAIVLFIFISFFSVLTLMITSLS